MSLWRQCVVLLWLAFWPLSEMAGRPPEVSEPLPRWIGPCVIGAILLTAVIVVIVMTMENPY